LQEDHVHVVASNCGPGLSEPQPLPELEHPAPRKRYTLMKKKSNHQLQLVQPTSYPSQMRQLSHQLKKAL